MSILWAHKFKSVTSVRTECGVTFRNKFSERTGRRLGCLANLKGNFGSFTQQGFVLRTEAACVPRWDGSCEDGSGFGSVAKYFINSLLELHTKCLARPVGVLCGRRVGC